MLIPNTLPPFPGPSGSPSLILGTNNSETLYGDWNRFNKNDMIYANGGDDTVYAGYGDDYVHGGSGNDYLFSGAGNDTVFGGTGDD